MNQELTNLQQAIDGLEGADVYTKTSVQWLLMDLADYLKKPAIRNKESLQHHIDSYQESWILWKAKQ